MTEKWDAHRDKTLIAEQPGMSVLMGGLVLALTLGGLFRAVFSPYRIKAALGTVLSQSHIEAQVRFSNAMLSLSHQGWPRLSILVQKIKVESMNPCLLSPSVDIDELELPISVADLIKGHFVVDHLRAGVVEVQLRKSAEECLDWSPAKSQFLPQAPVASSAPSHSVSQVQNIRFQATDVKSLRIEQLNIKYLPVEHLEIKVAHFKVELKRREPRLISVRGDLLFPKENFGIDYLSSAHWSVELSPDHTTSLIEGFLREGLYKWTVKYENSENEFESDLQVKHAPLSQLYKIARHRHVLEQDLNVQQMWMSLSLRVKEKIQNLKKARLNFTDFKLEGDLGDVEAPQFFLEPLENPQISPLDLQIKDFSLAKFFAFFNWAHPSQTLGDLGHLTGQMHLESLKDLLFLGEWRGLQLIFANKGQREFQEFDSLKGFVKLKEQNLMGEISQVRMNEGRYKGSLSFQAALDSGQVQLKALIDELSFRKGVQSLMTNQGEISPLSGVIEAKYDGKVLQALRGQLKCSRLDIEGLVFENLQFNLETRERLHDLSVKSQALEIPVTASLFSFLPKINPEDSLTLKNLTSQFSFKDFTHLEWERFQAQSEKEKTKFYSNGGWNENGDLHGELLLRGPKQSSRWKLKGKREKPEWESLP